jgi:tetratricopeptide (TPR) repeat protein
MIRPARRARVPRITVPRITVPRITVLRIALLAGAFLGAATLASATLFVALGSVREHDSLQDLLARLRLNRDTVVNALRAEVDGLLGAMEQQALTRDLDALDAARGKLVALGPEVATLLVDVLDPGAQSTDAEKLRSQYVMLALGELKSRAIVTRLVEMAQGGSIDGRLNAIHVLGLSTEPDRAGPVLVGIYRGNFGELRQAALGALARLGGDSNDKILEEALTDAKPEVVSATLAALAESKKASMAPRVLKILAAPNEALLHQDKLIAYYRACPEVVDKATLLGLIRLSGENSASTEQRQKVLDFLPTFAEKFDTEAKKEMRSLAESPAPELHEGALVVLVLIGDRNARKELLAPYDEQVDRNKAWANSYTARGDVLYKIADYREAVNDYKKAIQLSADDLRTRQDSAYIGLAKSYAMQGKIKEAGTTLEKAPLTAKQLAALKKDPAFAKLVEHPKYKDLFTSR